MSDSHVAEINTLGEGNGGRELREEQKGAIQCRLRQFSGSLSVQVDSLPRIQNGLFSVANTGGRWCEVSRWSTGTLLNYNDKTRCYSTGLSESGSLEGEKETSGSRPDPLILSFESLTEPVKAALSTGCAPSRSHVHAMLRSCQTPADVDTALALLAHLRVQNASRRGQFCNVSDRIGLDIIHASIRAGVPEKGLMVLTPTNSFGFEPFLGAAHVLMAHAAETSNVDLLLSTFRKLTRTPIVPTSHTANIILRALAKEGEWEKLLLISRKFQEHGVILKDPTQDLVLQATEKCGGGDKPEESPEPELRLEQVEATAPPPQSPTSGVVNSPPGVLSFRRYYSSPSLPSSSSSSASSVTSSSASVSEDPTPEKEDAKEKISVTWVLRDGTEKQIQVPVGMNMLEAAHQNDIDLEGACEGSLACSTCHVIFLEEEMYEKLPEPSDEENDMLDLAFGLTDTSRLGCQVVASKELEGLSLLIPSPTSSLKFKP